MTLSPHAQFVALHDPDVPLLLPNAWDAASARLWQEAGATAIATTSAAVAWALGHADGWRLPPEALLGSLPGIDGNHVGSGKSVSVRVDTRGRRLIKQKKIHKTT